MFNKKDKTLKRKVSLNERWFNFKYKFKPKLTDEEYKIAEEYMINNININMMEKDLLLRGMSYKGFSRVLDARNHLNMLLGRKDVKILKDVKELKGGILDGIRRS